MLPQSRLARAAAAVALGLTLALGVALLVADRFAVPPVAQAGIGGPFALTDQDGRPRTDRDFRGRPMLVVFGYTYCPDVCPLTLQLMADAIDALGPAADKVQPVFITVDPARDTPAAVKSYVEHFSNRIVGLTGTPEAVAAAARAYRVYYKLRGDPATDRNYLVDHSSFIYLMDAEGRFLTHFSHETPPAGLAAGIKRFL